MPNEACKRKKKKRWLKVLFPEPSGLSTKTSKKHTAIPASLVKTTLCMLSLNTNTITKRAQNKLLMRSAIQQATKWRNSVERYSSTSDFRIQMKSIGHEVPSIL
jgi:hypothetical protein